MTKSSPLPRKPFALLVDPESAIAAAKRLAAHLPPYSSQWVETPEDKATETELIRQDQ